MHRAVLGCLLVVCTSPPILAQVPQACPNTPGKVGVTTTRIVDEPRGRPLDTRIWYPAAMSAEHVPVDYGRMFRGCAAPDGPYRDDGTRHPLILISHGDRGANTNQSWLAEYLAARGYIVAAVDHWQNTTSNNTPEGTVRSWLRPGDLSFVATALLSDQVWRARMDPDRIGVAGHSSGGHTALMLVGARFNPALMRRYCAGASPGPDCDLSRGADLSVTDTAAATADYTDNRIKAAFVMTPAMGPGTEQESLARIRRPVHLVYVMDDEVLIPRLHGAYYAREIAGVETSVLEKAGHFAFLPICTEEGLRIAASIPADLCGRRVSVDRATVHRQIEAEAFQFFERVLRRKN
jgi:predicted dienelactone hydrolase